jgi:hypothetical protein
VADGISDSQTSNESDPDLIVQDTVFNESYSGETSSEESDSSESVQPVPKHETC